MRKLHDLALALRNNNFEMTQDIKNEFEEFLSVITAGSRVFHPRFGVGTVTGTQGNNWVTVKFDKKVHGYYYETHVYITSCTSMDLLIRNELERSPQAKKSIEPKLKPSVEVDNPFKPSTNPNHWRL